MTEHVLTENAARANSLRQHCRGVLPLEARLEPWMQELCDGDQVLDWVEQYGSPLNVINVDPLQRNVAALNQVAASHELDFRVYFARKANKCLSLVDGANDAGAGIDTASLVELQQVLRAGVDPARIICTAAIKDDAILDLCVEQEVVVAIDNEDEFRRLVDHCHSRNKQASIALRLSGFAHQGQKLDSRFGIDIDDCLRFISDCVTLDSPAKVVGVHFHLDGYDADQRVSAITQSLATIDQLREQGHKIQFLDMGGGFPMSYLESGDQWGDFWQAHAQSLLGERDAITFHRHGLGFHAIDGKVHGTPNCYPYYQSPVQAEWFQGILSTESGDGNSIAQAIQQRELQLRCEPGRSILDGCGMTIARVEFRKQHPGGDWFIGLAMNGTQCRTSSDDFLLDPIVIQADAATGGESMEGFLVGAYCMESDLLLLRKLHFPKGVNVGDLIVFPNTGGYLMHFMESRSHQFPLAKNVVYSAASASVEVDPIDA